MERQKNRIMMFTKQYWKAILLFMLVMDSLQSAQGYPRQKQYDCKFYQAYIEGEMSQWPDWIDQLETIHQNNPDPVLLYDIVKAYYGYVAYLIGIDNDESAGEYLERADSYLEKLRDVPGSQARYEAMRGAFIAFKIGMNRSRAIWLGPQSMDHINRAVELDPSNPVGWVEKGNAEYHMPRIFGGSYKKAADYYEKAVHYFEQQNQHQCNWMYMNARAWLAQSYQKAHMREKAETTYRRILSEEPEFKWVREDLYPRFENSQYK